MRVGQDQVAGGKSQPRHAQPPLQYPLPDIDAENYLIAARSRSAFSRGICFRSSLISARSASVHSPRLCFHCHGQQTCIDRI